MGFDIAGVATLSAASGVLSLDGTVSNIMKVNASGILTRSLTPYMRGQLSGKGSPYNAGAGNPLLITADINRGNCWNNATGYFTAPVAGYYMATLGAIASANSGYPNLLKNGGGYNQQHWNHTGGWHYVTISTVVQCAANDNICWIIQSPGPATAGFYGDGGHGMYSIALLA
jgi:hypothetical protein